MALSRHHTVQDLASIRFNRLWPKHVNKRIIPSQSRLLLSRGIPQEISRGLSHLRILIRQGFPQ